MTAPLVRSPRLALRANLHLFDYAILGLAVTSLLIFLLDRTGALPQLEERALFVVDISLTFLYAVMFGAKWVLADKPWRWFRRNAIYALGTLPITVNFLVADRYFIVLQALIVIARIGEALDRAFGEKVLQGILDRYRAMLVEELSAPLLMRLAIVLEEAVLSRDYAAAIGRRLDERRDLMEASVRRAIAASPKLTRVAQFGPVERWIDETTHEIVDAAHAALTGPEINLLIHEGLQDVFAELKDGIAHRKWQGKGVGITDVATAVARPRTETE